MNHHGDGAMGHGGGPQGSALHLRPPFLTGSIVPLPPPSLFSYFATKPVASRASLPRPAVAVDTVVASAAADDIEALFSEPVEDGPARRGGEKSASGASSVSSGVRLENIIKSFEGVTVIKDVSWEVKNGEKVGLVGVNGAGKTPTSGSLATWTSPTPRT